MFFHYNQNNSGGSFNHDSKAGISHHVIIEADSASEADSKAENIGLYFDGDGDCPCCGSRWSTAYGEGDPVPEVYGQVVTPGMIHTKNMGMKWIDGPEGYIHYADGSFKPFGIKI
jgi:hypothetical protein